MLVLLSIRPPHVENIFAGLKTFEYRRRVFSRTDVRTVLVYCTKPIGKIVGEFDIDGVLQDNPERLWRKTREGSGISKRYFLDYFAGRDLGFALKIGKVRLFSEQLDPNDLIANFFPPQSYMYMAENRYVQNLPIRKMTT
ncbi:ASCH domain-containing protein [Bradyrhizobium sp. AUGA SZCCT0169]|uniref:ASCH domain-containing protein n=1 Tax=Bradyrhizobium sp. AUGA SZCCT0169 TaxID=2807663 RepID=UPI001BA97C92|nr:ASCH domain-containing protein [Bradyrhizobium sp. AUGA SZCCT0169]MBR1245984.1 ASCH domain-containing protein [Bradyrhizobium sp. AUGA SZCCT0169]